MDNPSDSEGEEGFKASEDSEDSEDYPLGLDRFMADSTFLEDLNTQRALLDELQTEQKAPIRQLKLVQFQGYRDDPSDPDLVWMYWIDADQLYVLPMERSELFAVEQATLAEVGNMIRDTQDEDQEDCGQINQF